MATAKKPKKPASKKPASKKPASKKPASKKPASKKPVPKKPVPKKPASRKSVSAAPLLDRAATAKLERAWKTVESKLRPLVATNARVFDERYELAAKVLDHEPPLYLAAGIRSFSAFCSEVLKEDERVVRRNVRVARYATPSHVTRYGVHKLDAAIDWIESKSKKLERGAKDADFDALRIPVDVNGKKRSLSLGELTVKQIAATVAAKANTDRGRPAKDPLVARIEKALAKSPLDGVTVAKSQGRLSFKGVPQEWTAEFVKRVGEAFRAHETDRAAERDA
jgi:hypothetical protein